MQADTPTQSAATPNGEKDVALGLTLMSYEQYPQAVDVLTRGLKEGGVQNPPNAQLLLGIALLKSGNKDGAMKAFHAVKGDPKFEHLANLWALHARQA